MGGLATAVAAGLVAILLLQCFTVYMDATLAASESEAGATADQASLLSATLNERVQIDSVQVVNQTYVTLSVQNTGGYSIQAASLQNLDLILVFTLASNGTNCALWIPYTTTPSSPGWAVLSVTAAGGGEKLIDPMNYPYPTYGALNPSDTMSVGVSMPAGHAINATDPVSILMATPAGTTTTGGS